MQSALDCALPYAQRAGNGANVHALHVVQDNRQAQCVRQRGQGAAQHFVRILCFPLRRLIFPDFRHRDDSAASAHDGIALIDEDARQPRLHVLLLPQQEAPAPRLFQRGLHGIFAVSLAAQQCAGDAVEPVLHRQHALGKFRLRHCAFPPFRLLDGEECKKLRGKMNFFLADGQRPLGSQN